MEGAEDVGDSPDDGVYLDGLYLEAPRWDRRLKKLRPSNVGEMMSQMPVIHVMPLQDYVEPAEDYQCPLYKTNIRAGILNTTRSIHQLCSPHFSTNGSGPFKLGVDGYCYGHHDERMKQLGGLPRRARREHGEMSPV